MEQYLFVYGTLLADLNSGPGQILANQATFVGEAWIRGKLYDLGAYPGLVYNPQSTEMVKGHIFRLKMPDKTLPILDQYEGYDEKFAEQSAYFRATCPIIDQHDHIWECQVYLYQGDISTKPIIKSGDYMEYISNNEQHQSFIQSTKLF